MKTTSFALRTAFVASMAAVVMSNYDVNVATRSMYYSGAAYCDKPTLDNWSCGEPCTENSGIS